MVVGKLNIREGGDRFLEPLSRAFPPGWPQVGTLELLQLSMMPWLQGKHNRIHVGPNYWVHSMVSTVSESALWLKLESLCNCR